MKKRKSIKMGGVTWIMVPSSDYTATVNFFEKTMGFSKISHGTPVTDKQFLRFAVFRTANDVVLEVVEPIAERATLYTHPIVSIEVQNMRPFRTYLKDNNVQFLTEIIDNRSGSIWSYFLDPAGIPFQIASDISTSKPKLIDVSKEGINRILVPSRKFESSLHFYQRVMGFNIEEIGIPYTDKQFLRCAVVRMTNGIVLELVEPTSKCSDLYTRPVVCIKVRDLTATWQQLRKAGIDFLTDFFDTGNGEGWIYFDVPGASSFQLHGRYSSS